MRWMYVPAPVAEFVKAQLRVAVKARGEASRAAQTVSGRAKRKRHQQVPLELLERLLAL